MVIMIRNRIISLAFLLASCDGTYKNNYNDTGRDCPNLIDRNCNFENYCVRNGGLYSITRIELDGKTYVTGCGIEYTIKPYQINSSRDCINCSSAAFEINGYKNPNFVREGQCLELSDDVKIFLHNADSTSEVAVCFMGD